MNGWVEAWRARRTRAATAQALYGALVRHARAPIIYAEWGVPDTVDGRLEMLGLHAALVMRRLAAAGPDGRDLGQALFDAMFADIDRNLRELGVGDLSVGTKVKGIAESFFGRTAALELALADRNEAALTRVLERNVYTTGSRASLERMSALVGYLFAWEQDLESLSLDQLLAGRLPEPVVDRLGACT